MDDLQDIQQLKITRTILPELYAMDAVPFLPGPKEFSWEKLEQQIAEKLRFKKVRLEKDVPFYDQNPGKPYPHYKIAFFVGTLKSPLFLLVSKEQIENLARFMLGLGEEREGIEEGYLEGFKDFLVGIGIFLVEKQIQSDGWTLKAGDVDQLKEGPYLTCGVHAFFDDEKSLDLLVAMPKDFIDEWRSHYVKKGYSSIYTESFQNSIELTLGLEIGRVVLKEETFKSLESGDFVVLDQLLWTPGKERGRAYIVHQGHPLYLASVKAGGMKIVEQTNHYELGVAMGKDPEEFIDEDETIVEGEEDLEIDEDEEAEEKPPVPAQPTGAPALGKTPPQANIPPAPGKTPAQAAPKAAAPADTASEEIKLEEVQQEKYSLESSDILIKVEIGRLKMTLDKLTKLEPGNILKLNVHPENGVHIVVNEKIIGRGELVQIGDLVGVRILEIGL